VQEIFLFALGFWRRLARVRAHGRHVLGISDARMRSVFDIFLVVAVVFEVDDVPGRAGWIELRVGRDRVVRVFVWLLVVGVLVVDVRFVAGIVVVVTVVRRRRSGRCLRLIVLRQSRFRLGIGFGILRQSGSADNERRAQYQQQLEIRRVGTTFRHGPLDLK
jgi:hypothetical protein